MRVWFAACLAVALLLVSNALAVPFSSSSSPTALNVSNTAQLLNFTVQNIGSVNISNLTITLPAGFTFSSSSTTASFYTSSSTSPSWSNTSTIGIVGNGATQYFSVYLTTPPTLASFGFNVSVADANGVLNSTNVSVSFIDVIPPTFSSNTTSPSSNSTYSPNQTYWLNVTWSDNGGISKALIEHNFTTGSLHNETMSNSSSIYYLNLTDLGVGTYVWRVYANDTNNTVNSTSQFTYLISKALNRIDVRLNGTLNSNITSINNSAVNITVNTSCVSPQATCSISVSRDGTSIVSGATSPYTKSDDIITSIGLHTYSVTATGNANYTTNTSTYYVAVVPSYSVSTSNIPLTFTNTTSNISITFNSNPTLASIMIQGDWSGSATNFSMTNSSMTVFGYNTTMPAGTFHWTIFGNYSNHAFNITSGSFTINKATPTLTLNASPQWTLETSITTNVTCAVSISALTPTLYRNGTAVSASDIQTFAAGSIYAYLCNNTVNQNYTTSTQTNTLIIKAAAKSSLQFVDAPTLVEVVQNSSSSVTIKVKNTGNTGLNTTLKILGIDEGLYSVSPDRRYILVNQIADFNVTFSVGNLALKDISGTFNTTSDNSTTSQSFKLRVLPSGGMKTEITDKVSLFKLEVAKLGSAINSSKSAGVNVLESEAKLEELKSKLQETENYVVSGKYFEAYQNFETIDSLITKTKELLEALPEAGGIRGFSNAWIFVGVGIAIVAIGGFVVYLFPPPKKGYKPETGEYTWSGKENEAYPKKGLFERLKGLFSKLFKREPKTQPSG